MWPAFSGVRSMRSPGDRWAVSHRRKISTKDPRPQVRWLGWVPGGGLTTEPEEMGQEPVTGHRCNLLNPQRLRTHPKAWAATEGCQATS